LTIAEFYNAMHRELVGDMSYYTPIICLDGFAMSVQASSKHYSHPREDGLKVYTHYEVGFPSEQPTYFADYADQPDYTNTVYPWVPVELIVAEINYHGGTMDQRSENIFEEEL
jgi:hypothetical protein